MKNALGGTIGVGKKPHSTKSRRKIITLQEWADYLGVNRNTVLAHLKKYRLLYEYDPHDISSVLDFSKFLQKR
jgi:hypothetical protein